MARVQKSLKAPEQGYPHREHRSSKGREENQPYKKFIRKKIQRLKNKPKRGQRKGKWTV